MVRDYEDAPEFVGISRFYNALIERLLEEIPDFQNATQGRQCGNWNCQPNYGCDTPHVERWKFQTGSIPIHNSRLLPDGRREPLTDVFDEKDLVKVITEMPGVDKSQIKLGIAGNSVEIRANDSVRAVKLPTTNLDGKNALTNYRNGVIEVAIPKRHEQSSKNAIKIE
ncbi:MAG: hypothetical protein NWE81_02680 [Candidatus Bathyarchaeota archaeon]|nr:hypothetical protein [Candidatus Bathyarchaeota archaeon]